MNNNREKRNDLQRLIHKEDAEIEKIQQDINMLTDRLSNMMESTSVKRTQLQTLDNCILDTENAYQKILDSSNALLGVLKRETKSLESKRYHWFWGGFIYKNESSWCSSLFSNTFFKTEITWISRI